jgi:hypothetical protein
MAPISLIIPAILVTSPLLTSTSSTTGVPFGTALLIALGATTGLLVVSFISTPESPI